MIKFVVGNLFESDAEALVNTVNTVGVMGKGIALQFKKLFPNNFKIYKKACDDGTVRIGEMLITQDQNTITGPRTIVNFPTKEHWRNPSQYAFIEKGLDALVDEIREREISTIAIPPLGSGNGGLNWARVKAILVANIVMIHDG